MNSKKEQGKKPYHQPRVQDYGNIKVITGRGPGEAKADYSGSPFKKS